MKKKILGCLMLALLAPLAAQDAATISSILAKKSVSYLDFSYLLASELGLTATPFEAWAYCDRYGAFPFDAKAGDPITVKEISFFLVKNYGLGGGIMWSASQSPRYAWKELRNNGFWARNIDPGMVLSGRDLVQAVSKFFNTYPEARLHTPPTPEAPYEYRNILLADSQEDPL